VQDSWCRVSIAHVGTLTDLVCSADMAVGAALPDIVDMVITPDARPGCSWHLSRPGGDRLDEDKTLRQNGVRDGDVLAIAAGPAPRYVPAVGDFGTVAATEAAQLAPHRVTAAWAAVTWGWSAAVAAATIVGSMLMCGLPVLPCATAAGIAVTAAAVARRARTMTAATAGAVVAVIFSAAAGYLAVGTSAPAPGALLAASAAASSAVLLARLTTADTILLTTMGTCATLLAIGIAAAALWATGFGVSAAVLCTAAIATLGLATRLVVVVTGLNPASPGRTGTRITVGHTRHARRVLTGIVAGAAAAAAAGCALLATAFADRAAEPALAGVVTGVVLLRIRSHADGRCRVALLIGGLACATATSALLLRWIPAYAGAVGATAATVAAVLYVQRHTANPALSRVVDIVEVTLLAAAIPTAAWCTGIFGMVRELSLPW
jgi:type VII secretion integral membrane protein EccD